MKNNKKGFAVPIAIGIIAIIAAGAIYYAYNSHKKLTTVKEMPVESLATSTEETQSKSASQVTESKPQVQTEKTTVKKNKTPYSISTKGNGDYELIQGVVIDTSSYNVQKLDGYDLLKFSQSMQNLTITGDGGKPNLPVYQFKIRLPIDTKIKNLNVSFGSKKSIGKLNLPIINPQPNCMGCQSVPPYSPHPLSGIVPQTQFGYDLRKIDGYSQTLFIYVYPITYDNATEDTNVYTSFQIDVEYTTSNKLIIDKLIPKQLDSFDTGKNITVSALATNLTPDPVNLQLSAGLYEVNGINNKVTSNNGNKIIAGNSDDTISLSLQAPESTYSKNVSEYGDDYEIIADFTSAGNKIFSDSIPIRIMPNNRVEITCLNYPRTVKVGDIVKNQICIHNLSSQKIRAYINMDIVNYVQTIRKLPQSYVDLEPGQTKDYTVTWIPQDSDNMSTEQYTIQTTVSTDGYSTNRTDFFNFNSGN